MEWCDSHWSALCLLHPPSPRPSCLRIALPPPLISHNETFPPISSRDGSGSRFFVADVSSNNDGFLFFGGFIVLHETRSLINNWMPRRRRNPARRIGRNVATDGNKTLFFFFPPPKKNNNGCSEVFCLLTVWVFMCLSLETFEVSVLSRRRHDSQCFIRDSYKKSQCQKKFFVFFLILRKNNLSSSLIFLRRLKFWRRLPGNLCT